MRRFWILTRSLLTIMLRNQETLVANIVLPVGVLLLFGSLNSDASVRTITFAAWLTAGVMVQNIMTSGFSGDMTWLTSTRDRGILMRVRATPLPPILLIVAYVLVRLVLVIVQTLVIALVAVVVFDVRLAWTNVLPATGIVVFGTLVFLLLGQAIAAAAPSANAAGAIANVVFFPLLFLSDVVLAAPFPAWFDQIRRWNPAYMLVDLLRPLLVTTTPQQAVWINLVGLLSYGMLGLIIATWCFRWEPKR